MATIHDEIDNWLAADLHGELPENEERMLHAHLVECPGCRKTHQETKTMNKILEETLTQQKPDPAFEQRMLAGFRNRVPEKTGLLKLLADLMRMRAAQVTAVAAVVRRLDGIALAIELAAARVAAMTPAELARRLERSFGVLAAGHRGSAARHQTLRATIDWSFQLLPNPNKLCLPG